MRLKSSVLLSTVATFALTAAPSFAQEAPEDSEVVSEEDDAIGGITVTGTRIRVPNLENPEPTTSITQEFIQQRNFINVADAINDLPQVRGSVDPNGAQAGFGQGVNFINNFGLGSNRTLTLINGRRVVSSNLPSVFSAGGPGLQVDLNVIPTALVKRVDIVSTAGAPVYGSDAISGTVNLILDDEYEGLSLNATSGISERGDNFFYRFEGVWGDTFADGRGNIQISSFYTETDGVLQSQRNFFTEGIESRDNSTDVNRVNPNLGVNGGPDDGIPADAFFRNVRIAQLSNNGVIFGGPIGVSFGAPEGSTVFGFNSIGDLLPFNVGTPIEPARSTGGDGFRFSDFGQLTSDLRRFGVNIFANYDVTDKINVFTELQYYDARADELVQQPTFNAPFFGGFSSALTFQSDNPFLSDQARSVLDANDVTSFTVSRANVGIADLTGFSETEFLRGVVGARGDFQLFSNNWTWEAAATYGQAEVSDNRTGVNAQNFINAVNVTTDAAGNIICDADPDNPVGGGGSPIADPNCVPFNFFGNQASPEAIAYVTDQSITRSVLEQVVFNVNVSGALFELNGNSVAVSLGYEHRNEQASFVPDQFDQQGLGRAVAIPEVNGEFNLDEVFGELYVPLITPSNDTFIYKLDTFARGRYVDNTVNGGFLSWAVGGSFAPIEDIEFRGSFTRSFRSPAITELFSPQGTAFAAIPDLCEDGEINTGPNPEARERNCNAFLAAFPNITRPQQAQTATVPILNGGNPLLDNEEADSYTFGAIIRPRWIPRLSLTLDYININITQPIDDLGAAEIASACFDNDDFDLNDPANGNSFCSLIQRDANGEVIADGANPGVTTGFVNGVAIDYEGLQGEISYNTPLDGIGLPGSLAINGVATVVLFRQVDLTGIGPTNTDGQIGDPRYSGQLRLNYFNEDFGLGTVINYTGREIFDNTSRNPTPSDVREFDTQERFVTVDLNASFTTDDNFRFNFSVRNLFDRIGQEEFGSVVFLDDVFGRRYSISVTKDF